MLYNFHLLTSSQSSCWSTLQGGKENVQIDKQKGFKTLKRLQNEDKTLQMRLQGYKDCPEKSQVLKAFVGFFYQISAFQRLKNQIFSQQKIPLEE